MGSSPFARRYWGNRFYFLFLWVLRCFSSPRSLRVLHGDGIASAGLPHSEIHASQDICSSAWLIAAYHVLHRLREPRHPPCALSRFRFIFIQLSAFSFRLMTSLLPIRNFFNLNQLVASSHLKVTGQALVVLSWLLLLSLKLCNLLYTLCVFSLRRSQLRSGLLQVRNLPTFASSLVIVLFPECLQRGSVLSRLCCLR